MNTIGQYHFLQPHIRYCPCDPISLSIFIDTDRLHLMQDTFCTFTFYACMKNHCPSCDKYQSLVSLNCCTSWKHHLHPWLCTLAKNFDCWLALLVGVFAQLGGKLSNEIFWLLRAKIQPCFFKPFWWTIIGPCFVKPSKRLIMVEGWAQHCFVKPIWWSKDAF